MKIDIQINYEAEYPRFSLSLQDCSLRELSKVMNRAKKAVATQAAGMLDCSKEEKEKFVRYILSDIC